MTKLSIQQIRDALANDAADGKLTLSELIAPLFLHAGGIVAQESEAKRALGSFWKPDVGYFMGPDGDGGHYPFEFSSPGNAVRWAAERGAEPLGVPAELAKALIDVVAVAAARGIDLESYVRAVLAYRAYHRAPRGPK